VQTVKQGQRALDEGADILIAQGCEAGGHSGARSTFPLVTAIADLVSASGR
jgi:nitronate monooxygenase